MPRARPSRAAIRGLAAALLTAAATAGPAHAAITTNFSRSTVASDAPGAVRLERNGIVIGTATTTPATCWTRFTPEIRPGDIVRVGTDSMTVASLSVNDPPVSATPGTPFAITGTAPTTDGLTVELLDGANPVAGTTVAPGFTATGTAPDPWPTDPISRVTLDAADGITVAESATNRCSSFSANAVTVVDQTHMVRGGPQLNIANTSSDLTLQGPGTGATATLGSVTKPTTVENNTWRATFTAADLATLPDGSIPANVAGAQPEAGITLTKDTVGPGPPVSTPPPGRYINAPSVTLSSAEPNAVVHYTTDGSAPTLSSPVFDKPIQVTSSQTIRAFAVDAADNPGPVVTLPYQLAASGGPTPGLPGSDQSQNKPPNGTPAQVRPRIGAVTLAKRITLRRLRSKGLTATLDLASGTTAVRFTIYRRVKVKRRTRLKLVASIIRLPGHAGRYRAKFNARSVGLTTPGLYQLKIVPGLSRSTLDQSAARTVWLRVVR